MKKHTLLRLFALVMSAILLVGALPKSVVAKTAEGLPEELNATTYSGTGYFIRVTSLDELEAGEYYVVWGHYYSSSGSTDYSGALTANASTPTTLSMTAVTVSSNAISNPAARLVWRLGGEEGAWTLYNENQSVYAEILSSGITQSSTATSSWTIASDYSIKSNTASRYLAPYRDYFNSASSMSSSTYYKIIVLYKMLFTQNLNEAITAAQELRDSTTISEDGSELPNNVYWTPQAARTTFNTAISTARGKLTATSQAEIDSAVTALEEATAAFEAVRQPGLLTLPEHLAILISTARELLNTTAISVDGMDTNGGYWVTQAVYDALLAAVTTAETALTSSDPTEIDEAALALNAEIAAFSANRTNMTLYSGRGKFVKINSTDGLVAGAYYVMCGTYTVSGSTYPVGAMTAHSGTSGLRATDVTITNDTIIDPITAAVWRLEDVNGNWRLYNEEFGKYAEIISSTASTIRLNADPSMSYTVSYSSSSGFKFTAYTRYIGAFFNTSALTGSYSPSTSTTTGRYQSLYMMSTVSYTDLEAAIQSAQEQLAGVSVSPDGQDILIENYWVTQAAYNALASAITTAQGYLSSINQSDVDSATATLEAAIDTFTAAKSEGTLTPGLILASTIEQANTLLVSLPISADGSEIPVGSYWVSQAAYDALNTAIATAETFLTSQNQSDIEGATADLEQAMAAFRDSKAEGTLTTANLSAKITAAGELLSSVPVDENGENTVIGSYWVTQTAYDALNAAIATAEAFLTSNSQTDIDNATTTLQGAMDTFTASKAEGTRDPVATLRETITAAQELMNATPVSVIGDDVPEGSYWVTQAVHDTLASAITRAQGYLTSLNQATIDSAVTSLQASIDSFNAARLDKITYLGKGTFTKITSLSELTAGSYYVLHSSVDVQGSTTMLTYSGALATKEGGSTRPSAYNVTIENDTITNPNRNVVWRLDGRLGAWMLYNEQYDHYLEIVSDTTSGFAVNQEPTTSYTVSWDDTKNFIFQSNHESSGGRCISYYAAYGTGNDYRSYVTPANPLYLYKLEVNWTGPDYNDLSLAIETAEQLLNTTAVAENGENVSVDSFYVTQEVYDELDNELYIAQCFLELNSEEQTEIDGVTATLTLAIEAFNNAKLAGGHVPTIAEAKLTAVGSSVTTRGYITYKYGNDNTITSTVISDYSGTAGTINGLIIYDAMTDYNVGDYVQVVGNLALSYNVPELETVTVTALAAPQGQTAPEVQPFATWADVLAAGDEILGEYICVTDVTLGAYASASSVTHTDSQGTQFTMYKGASYSGALSENTAVTAGSVVILYGVYSRYYSTPQMRVGSPKNYAWLTDNQFIVRFYDGLNNLLKVEIVESGEAATAPMNPVRTGYSFMGWDVDFSSVTANLDVTATWSANTYVVTIGDCLEAGCITVTVDGSVVENQGRAAYGSILSIDVEQYAGYELISLFVNGEELIGNTYTMGDGNITITATFKQVIPAVVNFYTNGLLHQSVNTAVDDTLAYALAQVTNIPNHGDMMFMGWTRTEITTPLELQPTFADESDIITTSVVNLYAVYVNVSSTGVREDFAMATGLLDGDYVLGAILPTADTYALMSGVKSSETSLYLPYTEAVSVDGIVNCSDANLVWSLTRNELGGYTLQNIATGKFLSVNSDSTFISLSDILTDETTFFIERVEGENLFFIHPNEGGAASQRKMGCSTSTAQYRAYSATTSQTESIRLYIGFFASATYSGYQTTFEEATTFTISFDAAPGTNGPGEVTGLASGSEYVFTNNYPAPPEGYTFEGWTDGTQTYLEGSRLVISTMNILLTAVYEPISYTLTFNTPQNGTLTVSNGVTDLISPATVSFGTELTVLALPTEDSRLVSLTVNGEPIENGSYTMGAGDVQITAAFELLPAAVVNFYNNGVLCLSVASKQSYTFAAAFEQAGTPVYGSMSFVGWTRTQIFEPTDTEPLLVAGTDLIDAGAINLYAVYMDAPVGAGANTYVRVSELTPGKYVVGASRYGYLKNYGMITTASYNTTGYAPYVETTVSNNTITTPLANWVWVLSGDSTNGYTLKTSRGGSCLEIDDTVGGSAADTIRLSYSPSAQTTLFIEKVEGESYFVIHPSAGEGVASTKMLYATWKNTNNKGLGVGEAKTQSAASSNSETVYFGFFKCAGGYQTDFEPRDIAPLIETLGAGARMTTWDKIRFGARIGVDELKQAMASGGSFTYGTCITPKANLAGDTLIDGTAVTKSYVYYGSAAGDTIGLNWQSEYNDYTTEQLVAVMRAAGFRVYAYDADTISFVLIIQGMSSTERQNADLVFRPFIEIDGVRTYGMQKYNSISNIRYNAGLSTAWPDAQ